MLLVGAMGAWAFFQPFYDYDGLDFEVSAYRMVVGFSSIEQIGADRLGVPTDSVNTDSARERLREVNEWVKGEEVVSNNDGQRTRQNMHSFVPWYFLTVAALLAVAFYSFVERKLRNGAAWATVIASLAALWGFSRAWRFVGATDGVQLGLGAWILGATGVLAVVVAIASMIREDPGGFFKNSPTDDDEIVEELEDPHGRRTVRDPRDL